MNTKDMINDVFPTKTYYKMAITTTVLMAIIAPLNLPLIRDAVAMTIGFTLFAINFWLIVFITGTLFNIQNGESKIAKNILMLLATTKVLLLFCIIYVLIAFYKLSGIYIMAGLVSGLIILGGWASYACMKYLSNECLKAKRNGN